MNRETLAIFIGYGVFTMWGISLAAQIFIKGYEPSHYVHLAMMAVVGSSFGVTLLRKDKNDDPPVS